MDRKAIVNVDTSAITAYLELCEKVNKKTAELIPLLEELRTAELTLSYETSEKYQASDLAEKINRQIEEHLQEQNG